MELKEFIKILKKYSIFIVIVAAIGAAIGFFSTGFFASGYHLNQTYFVSAKTVGSQNIPNSNSENYYAQENLRNATDSMIAVLQSAEFQKEAVTSPDVLQIKKVAPQVIKLTYISQNEQNEKENLNMAVDKFNTKISSLSEGSPTAQLKAIGAPQTPTYSSLNKLSLLVAGALLGLVFALFVVGLKEYNKL